MTDLSSKPDAKPAPPTTLFLFGAHGDLVKRLLMPALYNLSRDGLRSALRYERMVELCNEGFRWFDIRRWDMAESVISGTLYAPALDGSVSNAVPTIDSDWHVTYNGQTFDGKDMNLRRFITMSYDPMKDALWPWLFG